MFSPVEFGIPFQCVAEFVIPGLPFDSESLEGRPSPDDRCFRSVGMFYREIQDVTGENDLV